MNELIKTARSAVSKNHAERGFFFGCVSRIFFKTRQQQRVGESISGFFDNIFGPNSLQKEVFWYTRIHSLLVHGVITALGCDQQNMEKILLDLKWAGHRLAHIFADGWSTGSHKRKMTLMEAPTGTLLYYYQDLKQEIVHTLLLEECGVSNKWVIIMDRRQDLNVTSTPAEKR